MELLIGIAMGLAAGLVAGLRLRGKQVRIARWERYLADWRQAHYRHACERALHRAARWRATTYTERAIRLEGPRSLP